MQKILNGLMEDGLLTTSKFEKLCRAKSSSYTGIVETMLYTNLDRLEATQHGICNEEKVISKFQTLIELTVTDCGLFIYGEYVFFGPAGLVGEDAINEVKCPYSAFKNKMTIEEAIFERKIKFTNVER